MEAVQLRGCVVLLRLSFQGGEGSERRAMGRRVADSAIGMGAEPGAKSVILVAQWVWWRP